MLRNKLNRMLIKSISIASILTIITPNIITATRFTKSVTSRDTDTSNEEVSQSSEDIPTVIKGNIITSSNENKFLGLWKNSVGYYVPYYQDSEKAKYNPNGQVVKYGSYGSVAGTILNADQWLFDLLSTTDRTQNHLQTMKYLMYKYSGKDYGVKEFNFSVFDVSSFNSTSVGSNWEKLIKYLHYFECGGSATTNADGTKYIVEDDGAGHPTVGYGVDINNCGYKNEFIAAGYNLSIGAEIDVEFVDAIEKKEIENKKAAVEAVVSGLNLKEYQIHALITRAYNCGSAGAVGTRNGKTFVEAYTEYWKETDDEYKVPPNDTMFTHALYTNYMNKPNTSEGKVLNGLTRRRKSEWILFKTGYYGYETEGQVDQYWEEGGGDLLAKADECHKIMEQNGFSYCLDGRLPAKASDARTTPYTCCATYVHWVVCEAGIEPLETTIIHRASALFTHLQEFGELVTSYDELQAGDIVFMKGSSNGSDTVRGKNGSSYYIGHTQIYAGDGQWYNAGGDSSVKGSSPYSSNASGRFQVAVRITQ